MAEPQDNQESPEKEGVAIADIVKCAVLFWSATLLTVSYLGIFPEMKMDNTFVASLLTGSMASFGIERKANGQQKKQPPKIDLKEPPK